MVSYLAVQPLSEFFFELSFVCEHVIGEVTLRAGAFISNDHVAFYDRLALCVYAVAPVSLVVPVSPKSSENLLA